MFKWFSTIFSLGAPDTVRTWLESVRLNFASYRLDLKKNLFSLKSETGSYFIESLEHSVHFKK